MRTLFLVLLLQTTAFAQVSLPQNFPIQQVERGITGNRLINPPRSVSINPQTGLPFTDRDFINNPSLQTNREIIRRRIVEGRVIEERVIREVIDGRIVERVISNEFPNFQDINNRLQPYNEISRFQNRRIVDREEYPLKIRWGTDVVVPRIQSAGLHEIFNSGDTLFYKLPKVYQYFNSYVRPEQFAVFPISYLPDFNANPAFPWKTTLGLDNAPEGWYSTINFIKLPYRRPIAIIDERPIKWIFPEGTTVGEIILVRHPTNGHRYILEVRTRTKIDALWEPSLYRAVENRDDLIRLLSYVDPKQARHYEFAKRHIHLRNPEEDKVMELEGYVERLPKFPTRTVEYLLAQPLKKTEKWSENGTAPSADQPFSIVPQNYDLGVIHLDVESCARCHNQTQIRTSRLTPNEPIIRDNPHLVGRIRGYDAVFTWHPFDSRNLRQNLSQIRGTSYRQSIKYRRYDLEHRIIAMYEPSDDYKLTTYVETALSDNELPVEYRIKPVPLPLPKCKCGNDCPCGDDCQCGDKCECDKMELKE